MKKYHFKLLAIAGAVLFSSSASASLIDLGTPTLYSEVYGASESATQTPTKNGFITAYSGASGFDYSDINEEVSVTYSSGGNAFNATATTVYGINHASASTTVTSDTLTTSNTSSANATSRWSDSFIVTGGTGNGTLTLSAELNGVLLGDASVYYSLDYTFGACDFGCNPAHQDQNAIEFIQTVPGSVNQKLNGTITFEYDTPFWLSGYLSVDAYQNGSADFSNSASLAQILLPQGAKIEIGSLTAYNVASVPVPAAAWLFGTGLLGLVAVARRRA